MNPAMVTGGLLMLPAQTPAETLLRAIYEHPSTSWLSFGGHIFLYTEDSDQEDRLAALPDVERLSFAVNTGRMRVIEGDPPADAEVYFRADRRALVGLADAETEIGRPWRDLVFATLR